MIKTVLVYIISFALLFFIISFSQEYLYNDLDVLLRFNLWDINLFLAIASFLICAQLQLLSLIDSIKTKLGFVYLPTFFIKGILFYAAFKSSVFSLETLNTPERLCILIPFLLYLVLEVYFVVKIITKNVV
ncbi:hypothetical protein HNV08_00465 [Winogradskyella eckloniae]|uniref:DUF6168 family protein n=1 Tax=Winogradskyella eckloniae TaxID=1089306 RepID=UPI0015672482|nr:DUF6168 family protein [Winogradskyella eckloniae]NRD18502.1 hypothetical protein [Winogradskyella eckloniae]